MNNLKKARVTLKVLDSDVIIHFLKSGQKELLYEIFDDPICVFNIIRSECTGKGRSDNEFNQFVKFSNGKIKEISFPEDIDDPIALEYARLREYIGKGEAACIAYAKEEDAIVVSSNLTDIIRYCKKYNITYLTTCDLLCIAILKGKITPNRGDNFLNNLRKQGEILPKGSMQEILDNYKASEKFKLNFHLT